MHARATVGPAGTKRCPAVATRTGTPTSIATGITTGTTTGTTTTTASTSTTRTVPISVTTAATSTTARTIAATTGGAKKIRATTRSRTGTSTIAVNRRSLSPEGHRNASDSWAGCVAFFLLGNSRKQRLDFAVFQ